MLRQVWAVDYGGPVAIACTIWTPDGHQDPEAIATALNIRGVLRP